MAQISDELAVQITSSFRLAQRDLSNQDVMLQGTGDVTITMPDNSTRVGPGWAGISNRLANVESNVLTKGNNLADIQNKSAARSNLALNYDRSYVDAGGGIVRLFSTDDSGLMTITRRLYVVAAENSSSGWNYNWVSDGSKVFRSYPGISVTAHAGNSSQWRLGVEVLTPSAVGGFIHNSGSTQVVWLTVTAIGMI